MALKPDRHTAVLVKERVRECLNSPAVSEAEKISLREFDRDLERYLR